MFLKQLIIANYKNIGEATLRFSKNINCFIGDNGMGKTNILDAIYYLSFCKSSLHATDTYNIKHDADFMMLQGLYRDELDSEIAVTCSLKRGHRKQIRYNGKPYGKYSEHIGKIPLVMISPTDSLLVTGGSEERRRFINAIISQYDADYLERLIRYENALRQRNALLRSDLPYDASLMDILEDTLAVMAQTIYDRRKAFVEEFNPVFQHIYQQLAGADGERPHVEYDSYGHKHELKALFQENREREKIVGYTLYGIHRDDLDLQLNDYPVRREGSQGQTKTYFIALKLAQFLYLKERGQSKVPLLLLDDVFDKLDAGRVERIIQFVSSNEFEQIFITDTNRQHIDELLAATQRAYDLFYVADGAIDSRHGTKEI